MPSPHPTALDAESAFRPPGRCIHADSGRSRAITRAHPPGGTADTPPQSDCSLPAAVPAVPVLLAHQRAGPAHQARGLPGAVQDDPRGHPERPRSADHPPAGQPELTGARYGRPRPPRSRQRERIGSAGPPCWRLTRNRLVRARRRDWIIASNSGSGYIADHPSSCSAPPLGGTRPPPALTAIRAATSR